MSSRVSDLDLHIIKKNKSAKTKKSSDKPEMTYLNKYKNLLSALIDTDKGLQMYGLDLYCLKKNMYLTTDIELLKKIMKVNKTNEAIAEMACYYIDYLDTKKANQYLLELADKGCDLYCDRALDIPKNEKNNDIYFEKLFSLNKSQKVFNSYLLHALRHNNIEFATELYNGVKDNPDIKPFDLTNHGNKSIINQVIYGSNNKFSKDSITNIYINKMNNNVFHKNDKCPICLTDEVLLIPFDCTHYVCAKQCYPKIMSTSKQCGECRIIYKYLSYEEYTLDYSSDDDIYDEDDFYDDDDDYDYDDNDDDDDDEEYDDSV